MFDMQVVVVNQRFILAKNQAMVILFWSKTFKCLEAS